MTQQETKAVEEYAKKASQIDTMIISNSLNESIKAYNEGVHNGILMGAQFLDELRKPSERPNIKDFFPTDAQISDVHDEITAAPRLYAYMQALDAYIDNLEEKPSETETNVCEAGKELVSEIAALLQPDAWPPKQIGTTYATTKIDGKLLCVQPDKELLEAAKDALRTFYGIGCNEEAEIVQVLTKAISNYEKQSK